MSRRPWRFRSFIGDRLMKKSQQKDEEDEEEHEEDEEDEEEAERKRKRHSLRDLRAPSVSLIYFLLLLLLLLLLVLLLLLLFLGRHSRVRAGATFETAALPSFQLCSFDSMMAAISYAGLTHLTVALSPRIAEKSNGTIEWIFANKMRGEGDGQRSKTKTERMSPLKK